MSKKIKEVFGACITNTDFDDCIINEIKYSKKSKIVIVSTQSENNICLYDIEEFEKKAAIAFNLNSFKVEHKYVGNKVMLDKSKVFDAINCIEKKFDFAKNIFECCEISVDENIPKAVITLKNNFSNFLKIRKVDEYIHSALLIGYGIDAKIYICDLGVCQIDNNKHDIIKLEELEKIAPINTKTNSKTNDTVRANNADTSNNQNVKIVSDSQRSENGFNNSQYAHRSKFRAKNAPDFVIIGEDISKKITKSINDISINDGSACIIGEICNIDTRETKTGKVILTIDVTDKTNTISCKKFLNKDQYDQVKEQIKKGAYVKVEGMLQLDKYANNEMDMMLNSVNIEQKPAEKEDNSPKKRVELHIHTQMSAMDAVSSATSIVNRAIKWGHRAVAITDHGVVQAFPEAHKAITAAFFDKNNPNWLQDAPTKVIYGVEGYLVSDIEPEAKPNDMFCVFDTETTGLSYTTDKITEIAACKVKDGKIIDTFNTFVNPERKIPENVQQLTRITDDIVKDAPTIKEALPKFLEFSKDCVFVAHNSKFDMSFINAAAKSMDIQIKNKVIDSLTVARELFETYENHKLGTLAQNLGIDLEGAHRADNDAEATAKVFIKMIEVAKQKDIDIYGYMYDELEKDAKQLPYNHIIILTKNYKGLKNLYKLISFSHLNYFHKKPLIPRSLLNRYRDGLIVGSACERGELFQAIYTKKSEELIENIAKYYDYLEIQPLGNNQFYIDKGLLSSVEDLKNINKKIVELGKKIDKPVVATTDSHFLDPEDEIYRRIIMAGQGFDDADKQPPLYFRTTEEMLKEFDYLDEKTANDVVIENPNKIADMCDVIQPVPSGTYPPSIEGSEEDIKNLSFANAKKIYGDPLPFIVEDRLEKELKPIIKYGFAVMYMIARKLVLNSNARGYLVGSRGSVGSSLVATMTGITEVNPLPPHYICTNPDCKYYEFPKTDATTGIDMPDKICPKCGKPLKKDGMDIPFETFLGFKGDKEPDIDLNFSGDDQPKAHAYTEVLFGKSKTFRAGTIGTIADKTAYGFVKKYFEQEGKNATNAELNRLSQGCTGIKRTTGQHPGGIIVVPRDKEIYDFCPIQRPADDPSARSITTHFDFHSIHDNLLKLDILGHDDPTVIRMLQDLTGVDPKTIPLDEPKVMSLFSSPEALGVTKEQIKSETGTYAVPEFGTKFVRQMLLDTKPKTFGELVRISGLSHGTNVWLGNAQDLIEQGKVTLKEAICTRDDIMLYLLSMGLEPQMAFKTMESVRKGKGLTEEMESAMKEKDVPDWYIASCKKIKYMFPKAHACAYVMMAYRIAYFKVYYPKEFYSVYLTVRGIDCFNAELMMHGKQRIKEAIKEYEQKPNPTQTEKDALTIMEVINEMYERNINFLPIDLYLSESKKFKVEKDGIRPPLCAITGFGYVDAEKIVQARKDGKFYSIEQLTQRAKLGKVGIDLLKKAGCLDGMPQSAQMSFFEM